MVTRLAAELPGRDTSVTAGLTANLRRVIMAAKSKQLGSRQPGPAEIHAIRLAWENTLDLAI